MRKSTEERRGASSVGKKTSKAASGIKSKTGKQRQLKTPAVKFTASDIVMRNPRDLKPFPNNPKIHTPAQVTLIAANMEAFGFDQPILIDETDTILKGHGRQLASLKNQYDLVPTIVRPGLSFEDKWAIVISDNALPAMTGFDQKLLRIGLTTLAKVEYPLNRTGFDNVRLATFIGGNPGAAGADADDAGELAERATSARGDVWLLGDHRLMCGDCSNGKTVDILLGDDEPVLMATDPPYKLQPEGGGLQAKRSYPKKMRDADVVDFEVSKLPEMVSGTNVFFTSKGLLADYLDLAREKKLRWDVAVLHRSAAMPNHAGHLMSDLDYIVIMGKMDPQRGLETAEYSKLFSLGHWERPVPWAKPVALMVRILKLYSAPTEGVFEPYCGSGTTIIAAETCGIELNPLFVDLAVRRWQTFTKKPATLQATGKSFDQVARERGKKAA